MKIFKNLIKLQKSKKNKSKKINNKIKYNKNNLITK